MAEGWRQACLLRERLLTGSSVPLLAPPNTIRLFPGEVVHASAPMRHEVWYGMDVTYSQSVVAFGGPVLFAAGLLASAVGNARARSNAARMAAEQWRFHGENQTILTNHRILAFAGGRWLTWAHQSVMELWAAPREFAVVLVFSGIDPLRLTGPAAPWFAVALAFILYGQGFLAERPEFQGMGTLRAHPQRASGPNALGPGEEGRARG
ncbi:hypothetical protein ABGB17_08210 [Sphaerisporangium sp. B11E5]|uniref:hypothetical protein n=1 Tax=Sphaerisporangium sp. B11E5 TaxID=3153563 RepID=UPI00325EC5C5